MRRYMKAWGHLVDGAMKHSVLNEFKDDPGISILDCADRLCISYDVMWACVGVLSDEGRFQLKNVWYEVAGSPRKPAEANT